jgi:hypothetical protein
MATLKECKSFPNSRPAGETKKNLSILGKFARFCLTAAEVASEIPKKYGVF